MSSLRLGRSGSILRSAEELHSRTRGVYAAQLSQDDRLPPHSQRGKCSVTIAGTEEEVLTLATRHAIEEHGHTDTPELREQLRQALVNEPAEVHA